MEFVLDDFLQFIVTLCFGINLINLPKQQFIIKTWGFAKTDPATA